MKVSIIGVGKVGSALGYAIVMKSLASELVLVSRTKERLHGESLDLQHATAFSPGRTAVCYGELETTANSHVVVFTLSAANHGQACDRLAAAEQNARLFQAIVPQISQLSPQAILLVISNPVDILTYATLRLSKLDASQVLGTGTLIDSARFRSCLSPYLGIHSEDIRAYILGEHGESQFPVLSSATVSELSVGSDPVAKRLLRDTLIAGHEVRQAKGYTNFGVASAAAMIIEVIQSDANRTMPVSTLVENYYGINDVCLSLPAVIGRNGIKKCLKIPLNEEEQVMLRQSACRLIEVLEPLRKYWSE